MINKCEWCGTQYPEEDETELFYVVYVFNEHHIICGSCKKHLKLKRGVREDGK